LNRDSQGLPQVLLLSSEGRRVGLQKLAELGSRLILLCQFQFLESGGEGVFETPDGLIPELLIAWSDEEFTVNGSEEFDRKLVFYERPPSD
jgi:hypothetical protein